MAQSLQCISNRNNLSAVTRGQDMYLIHAPDGQGAVGGLLELSSGRLMYI